MIPQDPKKLLENYTSEELCKIFKQECDKIEIHYSYDGEVKMKFAPLKKGEPELEVKFIVH